MSPAALQVPHSIDAEAQVLGSMLLDERCVYTAMALVSEQDFFRREHKAIYAGIREMHMAGIAIEMVPFIERARDRGVLEEMGGQSGVLSLFANTPSVHGVEGHCAVVRGHAVRRSMICAGGDLAALGYRPGGLSSEELAAKALDLVSGLQRPETSRLMRWGEACAGVHDAIIAVRERRRKGLLAGLPTGIEPLDDALGGLCGPKLVILAARPAVGKTAVLNHIGMHLGAHNHAGYIASLEMSADQLVIRGLAARAGVNATRLAWGEDQELTLAGHAMEQTSALPLWLDFDTYQLAGIQAQASLLRHQHGIEWLAVDHIGLVETQRFPSRNDQIGFITRSLKQLAKRLGIPVIALSQLSRKCDDEKRPPNLADLRDSGNVEQDADVVVFLHTPIENRGDPTRPMDIGVLKNRQGRTGWNRDWNFHGPTQRLERR